MSLEYLERIVEEFTQKKAEDIRQEYLCNFSFYKQYLKSHKKDVENKIVRLVDGTTISIDF
jgi:hypothetical protein